MLGLGATTTTLYATISGSTVTLPHTLNPDFAADHTAPLTLFAMGARTGDGNLYHDSYDISVQLGGVEIYSFADVDIEPDAARSLATCDPGPVPRHRQRQDPAADLRRL